MMVVGVWKLPTVEAGREFTITHSVRHFAGFEQFGLRVVTPSEFLEIVGGIP